MPERSGGRDLAHQGRGKLLPPRWSKSLKGAQPERSLFSPRHRGRPLNFDVISVREANLNQGVIMRSVSDLNQMTIPSRAGPDGHAEAGR